MNKQTILLLLLTCLGYWVNGQVLVSEIQPEKLLFGPENVSVKETPVADHWIVMLKEFQEEISFVSSENLRSIEGLERQKRLRRKDQRKLTRLQAENSRIEEELTLAEELIQQWQNWPTLAIEQSEMTTCLELVTQEENSVAQKVGLAKETLITEFIPTEYIKPRTEWVKKKADRNCLSSDPNDCLVWCLVEIKEGLRFEDYEGMTHQPETCPADFSYDVEGKSCVRKWRLVNCPENN